MIINNFIISCQRTLPSKSFLLDSIALAVKNSSPIKQSQDNTENKTKTAPDPFARPVKSPSNEEAKSNKVEEDDN